MTTSSLTEVVELPEESGLEVALKYAREYVEGDDDEMTSGQTGLGQFAVMQSNDTECFPSRRQPAGSALSMPLLARLCA